MASRSDRLKRILRVQEQLKAMHEMRRANELRAAHAAEAEAAEIASGKAGDTSLSRLFPDLYERAIVKAHDKRDRHLESARQEAQKIAAETVRTDRIGQDYRAALRVEERATEERNALETVERLLGLPPSRGESGG
ncbi:hypothetical protein [Aquibium sp. ELW1220]|uniref:hypothetical protein n=1 Tax=Aquibium sp. ELW1220 TaxID=2976766 RepID=UPI0025B1869C|nr:hypothetical protein [Aquibium sp. ELW1220]MDN2580746.1 hypothetical protein [Aquibium sp. ELW1220]